MTNLFVKLSLFLLVITIPFHVSALPTGAATCDVNQMESQGHGKSKASDFSTFGGYAITTSKSGQQITISITGTANVEGVLLYTQDSSGRTGTFTIPTGYQAKSCGGSGSNTITHTNSNSKTMPLKFTWAPPSTPAGNITASAIVVQSYNNWYKLQDISFDAKSGASTVSNVTSPAGSSVSGSGSSSDSGVGSWFKNYLLFIILMIIVVILYIVSSVTEAMLKNQRAKAKYYRNN